VDRTGAMPRRGVRRGAIGCVTALLIGLTAPFLSGCASSPRTFDFGGLSQADRLEITGSSTRGTRTVTDESTIQAAARFLSRHQEGWSNSWGSGAAPADITMLLDLPAALGIETDTCRLLGTSWPVEPTSRRASQPLKLPQPPVQLVPTRENAAHHNH